MIGLSRTLIGRFFETSAQEIPKVFEEASSKPKGDLMALPFIFFMSAAFIATVYSLRDRKIEQKDKSDFGEIPSRAGTPIEAFGRQLHEGEVTAVSPCMKKKQ